MFNKRKLADDETFVSGRSRENARQLMQRASELSVDTKLIRATTGGYIVPKTLTQGSESEGQAEPKGQTFDPADYGVGAVRRYLENADEDERQRVLAAEQKGKARKSLLPDDEGKES